MLHEPLRAVGRQSTFLHAVQHGGVSCMGVTNPSLALSGHARQFRAETLCSAKRGKGKGVRAYKVISFRGRPKNCDFFFFLAQTKMSWRSLLTSQYSR